MKTTMKLASAVVLTAALASFGVQAADQPVPGNGNKQLNAISQRIHAQPDLTLPRNGVKTLHDYIIQEKELFDYLFQNHPIFKYAEEGRIKGMYKVSSRGSEYLGEGNAVLYSAHQPDSNVDANGSVHESWVKSKNGHRPMASQYRIPQTSMLDYPNRYVGAEKCGECHAIQYEKWKRSRHAKTMRFPNELTEVNGDVKKPMYGTDSTILPEGVYPETVYGIIGTPRTKYGYVDAWLTRGAYHIRGGRMVVDKDGYVRAGSGTIVAGGCQFSRGWAEWLTPERCKEIKKWIPDFPTKLEEFGSATSGHWGTTSYGSAYEKNFVFQPAATYCEICHGMKFDYKNVKEYFRDMGNPKKLHEHTIVRGVSCEECHGAGGHLMGAISNGLRSNCERCHQRLNFVDSFTKKGGLAETKLELAFNSKTKSSCPSCGTEGAQLFMSKHYEKGMRCVTCHDPHEVTSNDWKSKYCKPAIKKACQDCHKAQTDMYANADSHKKTDCIGCHMPMTMTCENFAGIQRPDYAGFDAVRRSHVFKIDISPDHKMMNPAEGQPRTSTSKGWHFAKNEEGHAYLDLMWSCARSSFYDKYADDNKGCHSPITSTLEDGLKYRNQKEIYDEVMKWQTPVKDAFKKAEKAAARVAKFMEVTKLSADDRIAVTRLLKDAKAIITEVKKDGSYGVHAFRYTRDSLAAAQSYLDKAQAMLDAGEPIPQKTAKK